MHSVDVLRRVHVRLQQIVEKEGWRAHEFKCCKGQCNATVRWFLDTKDAGSTGNLCKHIKKCWGNEVMSTADMAKDADEVQSTIVPKFLKDESITAIFERKAKGRVTYSHHPYTRSETK